MEERTSEVATLAGGCFWCLEAVYDELEGVEDVVSGYAGGTVANPCSGWLAHPRAVHRQLRRTLVGVVESA